MDDWVYWTNNPAGLARMVVPDVYEGRGDLIPPDMLELRAATDKSAAVGALYDLLKAKCLRYDLEPPTLAGGLGIAAQQIRQPRDLLDGGRATCLDLALAFCGMCENARLRPLLALLTFGNGARHALVVVGPYARDDPNDPLDALQLHDQGIWSDIELADLASRMPHGWVAVDLTMAAQWIDATGVERPVEFDEACRFALSLLADAAAITVLDIVYLHKNGQGVLPAESLSAVGKSELSAAVRSRYQDQLVAAGLPPPERWSLAELTRLRREHQRRVPGSSSTGDLLEALCAAAVAKPVLARVGGPDVGSRKLQELYRHHVGGGWPGVADSDELLVLAASAGIAQRRGPRAQEPLTPLAQFMLGIVGYLGAPAVASLEDPQRRFLADWITGPLELKRIDADAYLMRNAGRKTWAIIELDGDDSTMTWPERVFVDSMDDHGQHVGSFNIACADRSKDGLLGALRKAIAKLSVVNPDLRVDLLMPVPLLTAGVERFEAVDVDGVFEPMTKDLEPLLGWRRHRYEGKLRDRLTKRSAMQDWMLNAEVIPRGTRDDKNAFEGWLELCNARTSYPPYFCGIASANRDHDPLRALLRDGYGFFAWFCMGTDEAMAAHAASLADPVDPAVRRNALPDILSMRLASHQATIIWSDPEGRPGFPDPPTRVGGQNKEGGR